MFFSIVIPVYNRPDEIRELLESLTRQTYGNFEVLVIEDGSEDTCKDVVSKFRDRLTIRYFYKENSGQGFSRNYGFERAEGDYYVVFDSDCLIPEHYFETVRDYLERHPVDAWGGPDRAHPGFTPLQKAISYSMTSPLTTGGIRGNKKHFDTFHPRSFNMGISKEVYEETGGYRITRMGEDIEFSIRIIRSGFSTALIPEAYVYHKRRTSFTRFFKQLHFFGRARVNIRRFYPDELKFVHTLPALFVLAFLFFLTTPFWNRPLFTILLGTGLAGALFIFFHASAGYKSIKVGALSVAASFIQITAYGIGMMSELMKAKPKHNP